MERRQGDGGSGQPPPTGDRRRGDRRRGQAPSLQFRRATDVRLDGGQYSALLQRRTLQARVQAQPVAPAQREAPAVVDLVDRVVDLDAPLPAAVPEPAAEAVRCPVCSATCDPLWLVRHWVTAHPTAG